MKPPRPVRVKAVPCLDHSGVVSTQEGGPGPGRAHHPGRVESLSGRWATPDTDEPASSIVRTSSARLVSRSSKRTVIRESLGTYVTWCTPRITSRMRQDAALAGGSVLSKVDDGGVRPAHDTMMSDVRLPTGSPSALVRRRGEHPRRSRLTSPTRSHRPASLPCHRTAKRPRRLASFRTLSRANHWPREANRNRPACGISSSSSSRSHWGVGILPRFTAQVAELADAPA